MPSEDDRVTAAGGLQAVVVRGMSASALGFVVTQAITLGVYLALARLVTPAEFGTFAAALVLVAGVGLFAESGMLAAVVQRQDRVEEAANTALLATLAAGVLLTVLAAALAPLLGAFFDSAGVSAVAAAAAGLVLLRSAMVVPDALLRRRLSFARRTVIEPLAAVSVGAVSLPLCAAGLGAWGLLAGQYAATLVAVVLTWLLARWRPRPRLATMSMWRELAGYGRHIVATELMYRLASEVDTLVVGRFLGTAALGQFRYASRVALRPLAALSDTVGFVLFPALARLGGERARFEAAATRALRGGATLLFPTTLILVPLGQPLVRLLFGPQWDEAGVVLSALAGLAAGQAVISLAAELCKAAGAPALTARMQVAATSLAFALALAFVPLGLVGVAVGLSCAGVASAVYALALVRRVTGLTARRLAADLGPAFAAACVAAAVTVGLDRAVLRAAERADLALAALVAVETLAFMSLYVAVLLALAPGRPGELVETVRQLRRPRTPAIP